MQQPTAEAAAVGPDLGWWQEARFGLFIHWGLYALPARHEWVKSRERLTDEHYQRYFDHFSPDLFEPEEWARQARRAGMRYVAITTKHHEGFCLWDSDLTDYKVTNTPWGKDLLAPILEAFRAEGLKVGLYHSLIDWRHPEFTRDAIHPQRDDDAFWSRPRDLGVYTDYLHGQVRELMTRYGRIDYLFFDFSYPERGPGGKGRDAWRSEELLRLVRELQPGIVVNDRLDIPGDFVTPEQYQPSAPLREEGRLVPWEACQTLNGSWGYDRDNRDFKSPEMLVRMLVDGTSKGGNLLLNVGPTGRGEFDAGARDRLDAIGEWMRRHERSIVGAGPSPYAAPPDCRFTQRGNRLYLHLFAWPFGHVHLPGLAEKVTYAQLLNDASEIATSVIGRAAPDKTTLGGLPAGTLTLHLPVRPPDVPVPVIELFLRKG